MDRLGAGIGDDQLHQLPAEPVSLLIGTNQDGEFRRVKIRVAVQTHDAEHLSRRLVDRDERHGARVIDLGKAGDEGVAEFLDRGEETQAQVLLRHGGEERRIKLLVFRPDRAHQECRSVVERQMPLPFFRIRPDGETRIAARTVL